MPSPPRKWPRRGFFLLVIVFVAIILFPRVYPPLRHPVEAGLLLQALFAGEDRSWLSRWSHPPSRRDAPGVGLPLDIYLPGPGPGPGSGAGPQADAAGHRGCILLTHGMTDRGRRDPRLAAFARNLARLGFAAAVPELPGMRRFRPEAEDVDRISKSFLWLDRNFSREGAPCGMFGFSFAAGPALKAAARPGLRERTAYFIGLGAYFDLRAVLRHLTTGGRGGEPAFPGGPPVRVGKWLFLRYNMKILGFGLYAAEIEGIVGRKLADENADISQSVLRLPDSLKKLLRLIENRDPRRFDALFGAQPPALRALVDGWSMSKALAKTRMPLFLLHGRSDPFVPFTESERLAAAARRRGPGAGPARLFIADTLGHVDPGGGGSGWGRMIESVRLLGFVSRILTAMEGG